MEDIPPSYNNINPGVLDLLPPYISTASLVNLCLVSRAYYNIFIPHLWGSPASHFVEVANESSRTTNGINFANLQVTGSQNDMVYVALTRFKRTLRKARLSTRQLCHTLHLPPALSEIYGGPNSTWLREVLDWLPALQSLCLSGLPFFDHESLVAVDQSRTSAFTTDPNDSSFRQYPAKLLLAAKEPNVTWAGLSLLIPHLPDLVYLDLSYTTPARNVNVLRSLDSLRHLQVLKLRGIGLRDNELEVLAGVIGLRVRLLDVAENQLSDLSLSKLLQSCVLLPDATSATNPTPNEQYSRRRFESWPVGIPPPPDSLSLDTIRTVELDEALLTQLTNPLTGRLAFEDIPHGGITHLYISSNPRITFSCLRSLLDTATLHVLDAGDIGNLAPIDSTQSYSEYGRDVQGDGTSSYVRQQFAEDARQMARITKQSVASNARHLKGFINRTRSKSIPTSDPQSKSAVSNGDDRAEFFAVPGAEKLVPVMREKASKNLTHLRIDHSIATAILDLQHELREKEQRIANVPELPGTMSLSAELDSTNRQVNEVPGSGSFAVEMSSGNEVFEMDATPAPPRAELPGDIIQFAISPPIGEAPHESPEDVSSPIRGEGAMAPEVFQPQKDESVKSEQEEEIILNATGSGIKPKDKTPPGSVTDTETTEASSAVERPAPLQIRKAVTRAQSAYGKEMDTLTQLRPKQPAVKLHPSFLPNLRTLILTNLPPSVSAGSTLIDNLKAFIAACAAEARLALLKARTNYSLPPGRARQDAERQNARAMFALNTIVLEIDPEPEQQGAQRGWKHTSRRLNISKSSTGDMDSEALWSAAENDFSFFGAEGEESSECGIYDQEPSKYFPTIPFDEKVAVTSDDHFNGFNSVPNTPVPRFGSPTVGARSPHGSTMTPSTVLSSPRNLPLGRNRRTSGEPPRSSTTASDSMFSPRSHISEMPGTIPTARVQSLTAQAVQSPRPQSVDVVSELAKWRRERKTAYEQAMLSRARANSASSNGEVGPSRLAERDVYVEGYWTGEVKVVRNSKQAAKGKLERTGKVDVYGNYFEGDYLYP